MHLPNLSRLSFAQGFTLWHYRAEALRDVYSTGFFDDMRDLCTPGDHIHISSPTGGALAILDRSETGVRIITMASAGVPG